MYPSLNKGAPKNNFCSSEALAASGSRNERIRVLHSGVQQQLVEEMNELTSYFYASKINVHCNITLETTSVENME